MSKLLYVGQQVADELSDNVDGNLDRYRSGDFSDLEALGDWRIPLSISADVERLSDLLPTKSPEDEIQNSLLVGDVLRGLSPTLARENRLWIRLSHVECLQYSRARWLDLNDDDGDFAKNVRSHFFAPTLVRCRDEHSIARLWWNHHIASQIMPDDPRRALTMMLARADIRLNLVQRPRISARPMLGRGIVLVLEKNDRVRVEQALFRDFMKAVNLLGAGVGFEALSDLEIEGFLDHCVEVAAK